jgi:hypothetical protein
MIQCAGGEGEAMYGDGGDMKGRRRLDDPRKKTVRALGR